VPAIILEELTGAAGVTIEGSLLKDSQIYPGNGSGYLNNNTNSIQYQVVTGENHEFLINSTPELTVAASTVTVANDLDCTSIVPTGGITKMVAPSAVDTTLEIDSFGASYDSELSFMRNGTETIRLQADSATDLNFITNNGSVFNFYIDGNTDLYSNPTGGGRSVYVSASGELGTLLSLTSHKTNVTALGDTTWIYSLAVKRFNRYKWDKTGMLGTNHPWFDYGLLAEDAVIVEDEVGDYNWPGDVKGDLIGVKDQNVCYGVLREMQRRNDVLQVVTDTNIKVDVVNELTGDAGVTIESVLLKDGGVILADAAVLEVDTINEATAAAGVTIEGSLLKDSQVHPGGSAGYLADNSDALQYVVGSGKDHQFIINSNLCVDINEDGMILDKFTGAAGTYVLKLDADNTGRSRLNVNRSTTSDDCGLVCSSADTSEWMVGTFSDTDFRITNVTVDVPFVINKTSSNVQITNNLEVDTITELTGSAGVTIESNVLKAGSVVMPGVYATDVGGDGRDVWVDSDGTVGYNSSIRRAKKYIQDINNIDWIYRLNPSSFKYRKKIDGEYTEDVYDNLQYVVGSGKDHQFIINSNLCVDINEDGMILDTMDLN
jgi:hypothetical protein